jgi:hypothetical protein
MTEYEPTHFIDKIYEMYEKNIRGAMYSINQEDWYFYEWECIENYWKDLKIPELEKGNNYG